MSQDKERTPKQRPSNVKAPAPPFGSANVQVLEAISSLKNEFNSRIDSLESSIVDRVTQNITSTVQHTVTQEVQRVCEPITQQVNHHQQLLEVLLKSQQRMEINECKLNAVVTGIPSDTTNEKLTELIESIESAPQPTSVIHRKSRQGRKSSLLKFNDLESRNAYVKRFRDSGIKINSKLHMKPPFFRRE